jgi:solute carrier family 10 (sodium/bile acid cotransporter), member 7
MNFIKKNWFLVGLVLLLIIGFFAPELGTSISFGKLTTTILIILIFLITGYTIPTEAIKDGLKDFKLHLFLQVFIFVLVPLYFFITLKLFAGSFSPETRVGIIALACLPTTISSCVIFTQSSGGNTVGAMFNAALANLLGVFVSPLLLTLFLRTSDQTYAATEISSVIMNIGVKILIPIIVGQVIRQIRIPEKQFKIRLKLTTNISLLLIVFINFSKSAADPDFRQMLPTMVFPFMYLAVSFFILLGLSYLFGRIFNFPRKNLITVLYTAPQKTLAMGVPLLTTFFADSPELLGMALLPLLFYHPWQLLVSGFVKSWLARKTL